MEHKTYRSGEPIIVEGADTSDVFILDAGRVRVSRGGKTLRMLEAGEIFGEMALLTDQPRSATVTADSDVTVRVIGRDEFDATWRRDPEALVPILRMLCDRVRALNALVDELSHQSPKSEEAVAAHQVDLTETRARVAFDDAEPASQELGFGGPLAGETEDGTSVHEEEIGHALRVSARRCPSRT